MVCPWPESSHNGPRPTAIIAGQRSISRLTREVLFQATINLFMAPRLNLDSWIKQAIMGFMGPL